MILVPFLKPYIKYLHKIIKPEILYLEGVVNVFFLLKEVENQKWTKINVQNRFLGLRIFKKRYT